MSYTPLPKLAGWQAEFHEELCRLVFLPFEYGVNDCYTLGDAVFKIKTGKRLYKGVKYTSLKGALRTMKKKGFKTLWEAIDKHPNIKRIKPHNAMRGDLGMLKDRGAWTILVFDGAKFVGIGEVGLMAVPLSHIKTAFRI